MLHIKKNLEVENYGKVRERVFGNSIIKVVNYFKKMITKTEKEMVLWNGILKKMVS